MNLVLDECLLTVVFEELESYLKIERITEIISKLPKNEYGKQNGMWNFVWLILVLLCLFKMGLQIEKLFPNLKACCQNRQYFFRFRCKIDNIVVQNRKQCWRFWIFFLEFDNTDNYLRFRNETFHCIFVFSISFVQQFVVSYFASSVSHYNFASSVSYYNSTYKLGSIQYRIAMKTFKTRSVWYLLQSTEITLHCIMNLSSFFLDLNIANSDLIFP